MKTKIIEILIKNQELVKKGSNGEYDAYQGIVGDNFELIAEEIEKEIIKMIEDKYGYPYMTYDKSEQTWTNNYFLFDIKTETIYSSDKVKLELGKRFGTKFIENNYFNLISKWFKISNKYNVKEVI